MTARERFHAVMHFQPGVRCLLWEFAYWNGAMERWYEEGLPRTSYSQPPGLPTGGLFYGEALPFPPHPGNAHYRDLDVHRLLGLDEGAVRVPINWRHCPPFAETILEEDEFNRTMINADGVKIQVRKRSDSAPHRLECPVRDRATWEQIKDERFNLNGVMSRFPQRWQTLAPTYRKRDYPLGVIITGFFGLPRELLGDTRHLMMYYDDPKLMHDINDHIAKLWVAVLEELFSKVDLDYVYLWEDMAYKNGPLISPRTFSEFLTPYYKRVTDCVKAHGVDVICVDTDGDCWLLIPRFLEAGVTGLYPFEVQAGMNVVEVRKKYPRLLIQGGLDKKSLALGKQAIDAELEAKLPYMLSQGGYLPLVDHLVPPDVSWDSFRHYRDRVRQYTERYQPQ